MTNFSQLIATLLLLPGAAAMASSLNATQLNKLERAEVQVFLQNEVKSDLSNHFLSRIREADQMAQNSLLIAEPMSPETQAVLADGVYQAIKYNLAMNGIKIDRADFDQNIAKILNFSSRLGIFPQAFTIGVIGRAQAGIGGSFGTQFNFYFQNGLFKVSNYSIFGVEVGPAAMTKLQFYASLCFGACFGGESTGWYVSLDGSAAAAVGGGFFVEADVDVSDLYQAAKDRSFKELYQAKAIYIGFGFDVGVGGGFSVGSSYYTQTSERVLSDEKAKLSPRVMRQFRLR